VPASALLLQQLCSVPGSALVPTYKLQARCRFVVASQNNPGAIALLAVQHTCVSPAPLYVWHAWHAPFCWYPTVHGPLVTMLAHVPELQAMLS
jgi:hypothetical protein